MLPRARPPREADRGPRTALPPGACDCHVHLFAGPAEFARDPGRAEDPAPGGLADWCGRLRNRMGTLGLDRVVLVQSVIYREDPAMTAAALAAMGPAARGVALLRPEVTDADLDALHAAGFRGVRLDLVHPGALRPADLTALAPRLARLGWHVQVFGRWAEHEALISDLAHRLPCPLVLDHLAYAGAGGPRDPAFGRLLALLGEGALWVKLSSLYRQGPPDALAPLVAALARANPARLLWGSNWPHVRWDGPLPEEAELIEAVQDGLGSGAADAAFRDNPAALYGFGAPAA